METIFYYYNPDHALKPYAYSLPGTLSDASFTPDNAILIAPEHRQGCWPIINEALNNWNYIEDHRKQKDAQGREIENTGTPYWLTNDTWQSAPRYMENIGSLPENALLVKPAKTQEEIDAEKITKIKAELVTIDTFLPRSVEDLLESGAINVEQLSIENQERHSKKLALRAELAELESMTEAIGEGNKHE